MERIILEQFDAHEDLEHRVSL